MDNKVKKYIKENLDLIDDLNITTFYERAMYENQLKGIQIGDILLSLSEGFSLVLNTED